MQRRWWSTVCLLCLAVGTNGQTTQGMISGHVRDQRTGRPVANALIVYKNSQTNSTGLQHSANDGSYSIPLLSPGTYQVRVSSALDPVSRQPAYQSRDVYGVLITVAGFVNLDIELRPLHDVFDRGQYKSRVFRDGAVLPFFGPDLDPNFLASLQLPTQESGQLEPSMSDVIDPATIAALPLAGRDVYAATVVLPNVTTDTATTRSLGLAVNGQRPSSSNFLLDGAEENDTLLSGPALPLAPEMIQEYRVSTNNFSAEYGRTGGYITNAVTRTGGARWHGIGYADWNGQSLNANTFEHNAAGQPRNANHQIESGFSLGGKLPKRNLFSWTAYDFLGSRAFSDPLEYTLPTLSFAESLPAGSIARTLLQQHPPVVWATSQAALEGVVPLSAPVTLRRKMGLQRFDYLGHDSQTARQRWMLRFAGDLLNRPDFNWSPYGQAPLKQQNGSVALAFTREWSANFVSDLRASYLQTRRSWDLVLPELPVLTGLGRLRLPGACCEVDRIGEGWHDANKTTEVFGNSVYTTGPHVLHFGAGILSTLLNSSFETPAAGQFAFQNLSSFVSGQPFLYAATVSRLAFAQHKYVLPQTARRYRQNQSYAFLQEDWHATRRLTLNAGVRLDHFSAPNNVGAEPDVLVQPGAGSTFAEQIASAQVTSHSGDLYSARTNAWAPRLAFSFALSPKYGTTLRGGFGIFFDRPFNNFFLSASGNDVLVTDFTANSCSLAHLYSSAQKLSGLSTCPAAQGPFTLLDLTLFSQRLKAPRVQSFFLAAQQPIGRNLTFELAGTVARGRDLLATDILNRETELMLPPANGLPKIDYRTNDGFSDYASLSFLVRYRTGRLNLNSSYTWSHSIDNQSDPLQGEYFDFGFSNQTDRSSAETLGAFSLPGNTRFDRGNSDFDERQNFVGWATIRLPGTRAPGLLSTLTNGWSMASVFAARSGLPYSVYAGITNCAPICNTRANIVHLEQAKVKNAVPGGFQVLNPAAFSIPDPGSDGNSGRNAFAGPGFGNIDFSLARAFAISRLGEQTRMVFRADAFNVLNHTNLQNPSTNLGSQPGQTPASFGVALYGSTFGSTGFPYVTPLLGTNRQIQLLLRVEF